MSLIPCRIVGSHARRTPLYTEHCPPGDSAFSSMRAAAISGRVLARHKVRIAVANSLLACCMTIFCCDALAQMAAIPQGQVRFKEFLSSQTLIKGMTFTQSGNLFPIIENEQETPLKGDVLFKASVQSNSWFMELVTNSPVGPDGLVFGKSADEYWGVTGDRKLITRESLGEPSSTRGFCEMLRTRVEMLRRMGLIYLEAGSIPDIPRGLTWLDENRFRADTERHGQLTGTVVEWQSAGQPRLINMSFVGAGPALYSVEYEYEGINTFPPTAIVGSKTVHGTRTWLWRFQILGMELGEIDGVNWSYTNFLSAGDLATATTKVVHAGRVEYVYPDGRIREAIPQVPDYAAIGVAPNGPMTQKRRIYRAVILACFGLGFLFAAKTVWKAVNNQQKQKRERNQ
jgi:hypothetical protein